MHVFPLPPREDRTMGFRISDGEPKFAGNKDELDFGATICKPQNVNTVEDNKRKLPIEIRASLATSSSDGSHTVNAELTNTSMSEFSGTLTASCVHTVFEESVSAHPGDIPTVTKKIRANFHQNLVVRAPFTEGNDLNVGPKGTKSVKLYEKNHEFHPSSDAGVSWGEVEQETTTKAFYCWID